MQGLYFLLSLAAVAIVVGWAMRADWAGPDGAYRGFLAMKRPSETPPKPAKAEKWQRSAGPFSAPRS